MPTNPQGVSFKVDISRTYRGKAGYRVSGHKLNTSFTTERHTPDSFITDVIKPGWPYTVAHDKRSPEETGAVARGVTTPKHTENFKEGWVITLDDDNKNPRPRNIDRWLRDPFFSKHGFMFVESTNSTPERQKGHPTIIFDKPVTDLDLWKEYLAAAHWYYSFTDSAVKNPVMTVFNAPGAAIHALGNICTHEAYKRRILSPYRRHRERQKPAKIESAAARTIPEASGRIGAWVANAYEKIIDDVETAAEGDRYKTIRGAALKLHGLAKADWHDCSWLTGSKIKKDLLKAAEENEVDEPEHVLTRAIESAATVAAAAKPREWMLEANRTQDNLSGVPGGTEDNLSGVTSVQGVRQNDQKPVNGANDTMSPAPKLDNKHLRILDYMEPAAAFQAAPGVLNDIQHVTVPDGQYLGDLNLDWPDRAILDADTGIGKTTAAANSGKPGERVIVAMSTIIAIRQQAVKYPDAAVIYEKKERPLTPFTKLIFCTYDQLGSVAKHMHDEYQVDFQKVRLFVDEFHNHALSEYRRGTLDQVLTVIGRYDWRSVILMSGTPLHVPHPALASFDYIKVRSHRRIQKATMVRWQDEDGAGRKRDTVVSLVKRHKRVIILLENKGAELDRLVAGLVAAGIDLGTIYRLNSDNKYESLGQQIAKYETVPDDLRVLVTTSVFVESSNMRTIFDAGIVASPIHPAYAQQFVNRQRGDKAIPAVYVLHNGAGRGYEFDLDAELRHVRKNASALAQSLNAIEDRRALISDDQRQVFGGDYGPLVKRVGDRFTVDHLGIAQHVHRSAALYANENSECYKRMTEFYGWQWLDDFLMIITEDQKTAGQRRQEAELRQEYAELARQDWQDRVSYVLELGPERAENERYLAMHDSKVMRVIERALTLYELTKNWRDSCALLATGTDSTQSFNKLRRMVMTANLRQAGDDFVAAIDQAYEEGQEYSQDDRYQRLIEVYEAHEGMKPFITEVFKYSWSTKMTRKIDRRTADGILRLLFNVKEKRTRIDGQKVRLWVITGRNPLDELLAAGHATLEANAGPANSSITNSITEFSGPVARGDGVIPDGVPDNSIEPIILAPAGGSIKELHY